MDFWYGLAVGVVVGANFGFIVMSLMVVAKNSDTQMERDGIHMGKEQVIAELLEERKEVERQQAILEDRWEAINERIDNLREEL
jgi:uncharacterized membrane-anchored protein YhcB (DUF1043 family)